MTNIRAFSWDSIGLKVGVTADPAAGVNGVTITVPAGRRWIVYELQCTLVAAAVALNRAPNLYIRMDGSAISFLSVAGLTVTSGQTKEQSFIANSFLTTAGTEYGVHFPLLELNAGATLIITYFDWNAGDNVTATTYYYKEVPI